MKCNSVNSKIADFDVSPEIAFICIIEEHFHNDNSWKELIDVLTKHGMYNLITVTMRVEGHPVTGPETKELFKRLVAYANCKGVEVALDLDPRLARRVFQERHPDELQNIIYLHEIPVNGTGKTFKVEAEKFADHMTGEGTPYYCVENRFVKGLACKKNPEGEIIPESLEDISGQITITTNENNKIEGCLTEPNNDFDTVILFCEFTLFCPDVFSPHLIDYQKELLELYADLPLKGVVKDEWGFPPTKKMMSEAKAFWHSRFYEKAYAEASGGNSLLDDFLLMSFPVAGQKIERLRAINYYMDLNFKRNTEIEQQYYYHVKEVFGDEAFVAKHATWYPRINEKEFFKNGLSWWTAKRDIAQTDEITPLSACTALSKKFDSPYWLNEGYSGKASHYSLNVWRYALAGGRMVYHGLFPIRTGEHISLERKAVLSHGLLLNNDQIRAECRVRLLNFISRAQIDCPVAFVFGHSNIMNWAENGYLDYGEELSLDLWRNSYAVDLYPSSELSRGTFEIDNGVLKVGNQNYKAFILYNPDFCTRKTADFLNSAPITNTMLYVIGNWNYDFDANNIDGIRLLPENFKTLSHENALEMILADLKSSGVRTQPPLTEAYQLFNSGQIGMPAPDGICTLIDNTVIRISAKKSPAGDPIRETINVNGVPVSVAAEGVFAARIDDNKKLEAFAAAALSKLKTPTFELNLDTPADIALWRDSNKFWHGVLQGVDKENIPEKLKKLTEDWQFLSIPEPFIPSKKDFPLPI